MTTQTARAKSLILKWFDENGQISGLRGKLSSGIDRFFGEIIARDPWPESVTVLLDASSAAQFQASGRDWCAFPCRKGLAVSTLVPDWSSGWSEIFRDQYVYDVLSWLGHYARQYIHRSHVAKLLMIAWERDGVILHPFGSKMLIQRCGPEVPPSQLRKTFADAVHRGVASWEKIEGTPRSRSRWLRRNTLDPAIHQAVYHYLRGQKLASSGFELEALVAFDCVLQSLQTIGWKEAVGDPRRNRSDLVATLGLCSADRQLAEHIYFLRNEFVAHAGGWRWWDTAEYVDHELIESTGLLAHKTLKRAADLEISVRRIDPEPSSWSGWLLECFPLLFSAIWFRAQ